MSVGRALQPLGLDEQEEKLYLMLLEHPFATRAKLASLGRLPRRVLAQAMVGLEEKGLARRATARPVRYTLSPPQAALDDLRVRRQRELDDIRTTISALASRYEELSTDAEPGDAVEVLRGPEAALGRRLPDLVRDAKVEMCVFDRPPYATPLTGPNLQEVELLERGIRMRVVYSQEALTIPNRLSAHIQPAMIAGEEARVVDSLPAKLFIVDGRVALVPHSPGSTNEMAIVLHESALLALVIAFFERTWEQAVPLRRAGNAMAVQNVLKISNEDERILILMMAGMKDRAIAQHLGVAHATLERRVRSIMTKLGADTRFQLGGLATVNGIIQPDAASHRLTGTTLPLT